MSFATQNIPGTFLKKSRTVQTIQGVCTLAQLNAGLTILSGLDGRTIQLRGFRFKMNGAFAALTDMRLSTTEATPTLLLTIVQAQMGDAVIHTESAGTHTLAAAFASALAVGTGLALSKTGSDATTATSLDYSIDFVFDN